MLPHQAIVDQHYWNLIIRLFIVITRILVEELLPFYRVTVGVFNSLSWLGNWAFMSPPMIWTLRLVMRRKREDSSLVKVVMSVSLEALIGLYQETIVLQGLSLNIVPIILGWVFSTLFCDFKVRWLYSNNSEVALTEFFYADVETVVHPLLISWNFICNSQS